MAMHGLVGTQAGYAQEMAAKQCVTERNVYPTSDGPREVIMGAVSRALDLHGNRIGDALASVSIFLDRFFGPQPEPSASATPATPQPIGVVHEVERNLSRNDYLLAELEQKIRRLGDIA